MRSSLERRLVPELTRLRWAGERLDRSYRAKIAALPGNESRDSIEASWSFERDEISEEIAQIHTERLLSLARKYYVEIPSRAIGDEVQEFWERGRFFGRWTLTRAGVARLRESIRHERRQRYDFLFSLLAGVVGLIGALTGLVAVWKTTGTGP